MLLATCSLAPQAFSCIPLRDSAADRPPVDSDLAVNAVASSPIAFEGASVRLTAIVEGGTPPYFYRWDLNAAPDNSTIAISDPVGESSTRVQFGEPGRYVFRSVVTDSNAESVVEFVVVEIRSAVLATVDPLAVVGVEHPLAATAPEGSNAADFLWEVVSGDATIADPIRASTAVTASTPGTVVVRLSVTAGFGASAPVTASREYEIAVADDLTPRVVVETNLGDFTIELLGEEAPRHTANLLRYVDDGFYDGLVFHRAVCDPTGEPDCQPFVIQGGGYRREGDELVEVQGGRDPVESESDNGLSNGEVYTVALALTGGDADSGTTQFFVNLDPDNDKLDAQGFTVFGRVVSGTEVVDAIARVETETNPFISGENSLPVEDVTIVRIRRAEE